MQRNGRVNSGDVSIFYRAFGARGRTPILLMHGANYFNSYDWIGVAEALATDREVASFDKRGFGEIRLEPEQGLFRRRPHGRHARGHRRVEVGAADRRGAFGLGPAVHILRREFSRQDLAARRRRQRACARGRRRRGRPTVGNPPLVFESVEAAMAHFAKLSNPPRISHDRERAHAALVKVEKGYMLKRDPDFQNTKPQGEGANLPQRAQPRRLAGACRGQVPDHDRPRAALGPLHAGDHRAHFPRLSRASNGRRSIPSTTSPTRRRRNWWRRCANSPRAREPCRLRRRRRRSTSNRDGGTMSSRRARAWC